MPIDSDEARRESATESEIVSLIPALRAFARTFYANPSDADDLVQDTLMKGIAKIHQYTPGTRLKSWLFTIMRNTFYNRIPVAKREVPGFAECASSRPAVHATQEWSARGRDVAKALRRMPADQREIIVLIGVLGTSYEDAAGICGCAVGTVKSRLHRARLRLLAELGEESPQSSLEDRDVYLLDDAHNSQCKM
jgi:RNA polymerase sigma factor (sigma-70 family)